MTVRLIMLYRAKFWGIKRAHEKKIRIAEMRMSKFICKYTRMDMIRNENIGKKFY